MAMPLQSNPRAMAQPYNISAPVSGLSLNTCTISVWSALTPAAPYMAQFDIYTLSNVLAQATNPNPDITH